MWIFHRESKERDNGLDGTAMAWLEKQYPLWKSKIKAKTKNKCPW
jgi:hypothetical protein